MSWLILATIAGWLLVLAFLVLNLWNIHVARTWHMRCLEGRRQRDRLNRENAELHEHMAFVAGECRATKEKRDALQKHLAEADAQLQLSVQEIHRLREERKQLQQQLAERVYEVNKPRKRRVGQAVTTGEDGAI